MIEDCATDFLVLINSQVMTLFRPEVFQGSLKLKNYFEGWYFKQVTADRSQTIAIIPGISLNGNDKHSFIQVIDGAAGISDYVRYPLETFKWDKKKLFIKVGTSEFSAFGIKTDIRGEKISLNGELTFSRLAKYPSSLISPGIMGWYSFVPFMECNHGVVSADHIVSGWLNSNGKAHDYSEGKGYIEKDWGRSFPEAWIWVQSNNFGSHDTSFMLSVAKIPWLGRFFIGFISFLYLGGKYYLFNTYGNSSFRLIANTGSELSFELKNKDHQLTARVLKNSFRDLVAPVTGEMKRGIRESVDSEIYITLKDRDDKIICSDTGHNVGLEVMEEIFRYI